MAASWLNFLVQLVVGRHEPQAPGPTDQRFSRQRDLIPLSTTIPAAAARPRRAHPRTHGSQGAGGGGGKGCLSADADVEWRDVRRELRTQLSGHANPGD